MAQGGEAREVCELAEAIATEIQTQQCAQVTQAAGLDYAITLLNKQQVRTVCQESCWHHKNSKQQTVLVYHLVKTRLMVLFKSRCPRVLLAIRYKAKCGTVQ